jgi:lysyl-tRNA synthetase class 2
MMEHDFLPTASLSTLQQRAALLKQIRVFFDSNGYWEVETPILSKDIVVDAHIDPFHVDLIEPHSASFQRFYLQTSPEFAMKRLLAAGADAIYQCTRAFRQGEQGQLHNPEFTILEWYKIGDNHFDQMDFVEKLVQSVFRSSQPKPNAVHIAQDVPFQRFTYDEAFERYAGAKVVGCEVEELRNLAARHSLTPPVGLSETDCDDWLNWLLAELVEPNLGVDQPAFLYNYPASQAALARVEGQVAERFELYISGIEICNGYHELTDPAELRSRNLEHQQKRHRENHTELPVESRLLSAMESGLPACSGVALGFDRLCMLSVGAENLEQVLAFPFNRA